MEPNLRFFKYLELWALLTLSGVFGLYLKYGFKLAHLQQLEYLGSMLLLIGGVCFNALLLRHFLGLTSGGAVSMAFGINGVSFACTTLPLLLFNLYAAQMVPDYGAYSWLVSLWGLLGYYIFSLLVILEVYPAAGTLLERKLGFLSKLQFWQPARVFQFLILWAIVVRALFYAVDFYYSAYLKQVFIAPNLNLILGLILLLLGSLRLFIVPATVLMFFLRRWSELSRFKAWLIAFKILILAVVCIVSSAIFLPLVLFQQQVSLTHLVSLDGASLLTYIQALDQFGLTILVLTLGLIVIGCYLFNIFVIKYLFPVINSRQAVRYLPIAFGVVLLAVWGFNVLERHYLRPVLYQQLWRYDFSLGPNLVHS